MAVIKASSSHVRCWILAALESPLKHACQQSTPGWEVPVLPVSHLLTVARRSKKEQIFLFA